MDDNRIIVFPICLIQKQDIVRIYIPDIDFECRALDYSNAITKARKMIQTAFVIGEIAIEDLSDDMYSTERIVSVIKDNNKDEYLDAQILFLDVYLRESEIHGMDSISLPISKPFLEALMSEGIDYRRVCLNSLEEVLRRKELLKLADRLTGHTVEVKTTTGDYTGEIKALSYSAEEPWNFELTLQTHLSIKVVLKSYSIQDIDEIPLVMNKMGTFRLINQEGLVSLMGRLWWRTNYIDVYLEYDPTLDIDNQPAIDLLSEFNKNKYDVDEDLRQIISADIANNDSIKELFYDNDKEAFLNNFEILGELIDKMELWFIDIASNKEIYMDYNYKNDNGTLSIGVKKKLGQESFQYKINNVHFSVDDDLEDFNPIS